MALTASLIRFGRSIHGSNHSLIRFGRSIHGSDLNALRLDLRIHGSKRNTGAVTQSLLPGGERGDSVFRAALGFGSLCGLVRR